VRWAAIAIAFGCWIACVQAVRAEQAAPADLARDPQWRALLHYRPDAFDAGVTSVADQPDFFLAKGGKTDPQAELEATLAAFAAPAGAVARLGQHAQCAFPARFAFLDERLGLVAGGMARQPCPELAKWRAFLEPVRGVSLIFPEAFLNNPASMFGHTLLRIDRAPPEADEERRDLLAWAVNFAADTGRDGGALFAVKGIVGAYPGFFSLWPYAEKVKQYGDWESRDIWEYRLPLGAAEVERILLHVWELRDVRFDYYFFGENCSWALLGLLRVARPELDLQARFPVWAAPADTVRASLEALPLAGASWRPSAATRMAHDARSLSRAEREQVQALAALPDARRAAVLTLAYDLLRHRATPERAREERPRSRALLIARSAVSVQGEPGPPPAAPPLRPDEGHGTSRARTGFGVRDGRAFVELRARPAYHDLLDPQGGYTRGAQIDFLDLALRVYAGEPKLRLHELRVLDIVSLAPRDALFRPISWRLDTAITSEPVGGGREAYFWRSGGGAGLTASLGERGLAYAFAELRGDVASWLDPAASLGAGASAGVLLGDPRDRWRAHLHGRAAWHALGDRHTTLSLALDQRLSISRKDALELRASATRDFGTRWLEAGMFWTHYF
jgi:hypothetical protein